MLSPLLREDDFSVFDSVYCANYTGVGDSAGLGQTWTPYHRPSQGEPLKETQAAGVSSRSFFYSSSGGLKMSKSSTAQLWDYKGNCTTPSSEPPHTDD